MSVKSRFGSYFRGRYLIQGDWLRIKSPSSTQQNAPSTILDLKYSDVQGIYDLTSTKQFPNLIGPAYELGLSPTLLTLSGELDAWTQRTVDVSAYAGATVYLVFAYQNGTVGNSYQGDIQLDLINLDGNSYSFENTGEAFETSSAGETTYDSVSWSNVTVNTASNSFSWQVDSGGTGSTGTGRTDAADGSFYVYTETSSPTTTGSYFWLRSPQITLSGSPTLSFYEARLGANIGQLDVYLDVIA